MALVEILFLRACIRFSFFAIAMFTYFLYCVYRREA